MTPYIFDTDHLSLYGRNHPAVVSRMEDTKVQLITTAINAEEQLRGRLAQITEAGNDTKRGVTYRWLTETIAFLSAFEILQYDAQA
ncbi:type II toxin-antitoxin system VapC family toxin [Leptolyngbyaceae cyanobacterium UHCC 1019]